MQWGLIGPWGCACHGGTAIGPSWRGSTCLRSDQYMYMRKMFAHHNCLLSCMGITDLSVKDNNILLTFYTFSQHPDFTWDMAEGDDVGVMHLTTTLVFSESIQKITLSQETDISVWADATGCYITGWGESKCGHFLQACSNSQIDHVSNRPENRPLQMWDLCG